MAACPTLPILCLPYPATQQLPDFRHHAADVFVLTGIQPAPLVGQPQIEAQLAQVHVGGAQVAQADFVAVGFGFQQRFLWLRIMFKPELFSQIDTTLILLSSPLAR